MEIVTWGKERLLKFFNKIGKRFKEIEISKLEKLTDHQKKIYDICVKMIHQPESDIRFGSVGHMYQVESDRFFVTIKYSSINPMISIIDYGSKNEAGGVYESSIYNDHIEILVDMIDKEIHKRMESKEQSRLNKIGDHLNLILDSIQ